MALFTQMMAAGLKDDDHASAAIVPPSSGHMCHDEWAALCRPHQHCATS
jgi:hypothetical protein